MSAKVEGGLRSTVEVRSLRDIDLNRRLFDDIKIAARLAFGLFILVMIFYDSLNWEWGWNMNGQVLLLDTLQCLDTLLNSWHFGDLP